MIRLARQSLRRLTEQPVVLVVSIASLAVGISGTALLGGVVDTLLFRPPQEVDAAHDVVHFVLTTDVVGTQPAKVSFPIYALFRRELRGVSGVAAQASKTVVVGRGPAARAITVEFVSPNYFDVLGAVPATGAFFGDVMAIEGRPPDVVISHNLWQSFFAGAGDVIGRELVIGNSSYAVIGVTRPGFRGIARAPVEAWLPLSAAVELVSADALTAGTFYWLSVFARLGNASTLQVSAQATSLIHGADSFSTSDVMVGVSPIVGLQPDGRSRDVVRLLVWVTAASAILLLLACANVAQLLLVRVVSSSHELATLKALGAPTWKIVGDLVRDVATIVALAGLVGAGILGLWSGGARALLVPGSELPGGSLDVRATWQLAIVLVAVGILCCVPAVVYVVRYCRQNGCIQVTTRALPHRWTSSLVVAQCGISVVLIVGASLFGRSLRNVTSLELGLDTERVLYARVDLRGERSRQDTTHLYEQLAERVAALPGVGSVTMAMGLPLGKGWAVAATLPGDLAPGPVVVLGHAVGPRYFEVTGLRITRGRPLEMSDHSPPARVAVISETFATKYWPTSEPLGVCLQLGSDLNCTRVVGIAIDTPRWSILADREAEVYVPIRPDGFGAKETFALAVRATRDPGEIATSVRMALQAFSDEIAYAPVTAVRSMVEPQVQPWRLGATLFAAFGLVAGTLAGVGLYGLLAFIVAREKRAIGIRLALGATPSQMWRGVVSKACLLAAAGATLGVVIASLLAPLGQSLMFGVSAADPLIFAGAVVLVLGIAIIASMQPARQASRCDCARLLRHT